MEEVKLDDASKPSGHGGSGVAPSLALPSHLFFAFNQAAYVPGIPPPAPPSSHSRSLSLMHNDEYFGIVI